MTLRMWCAAIVAHADPLLEPDHMAMPQTIPWTRDQLDRLPDDGNRYEVLGGELLVTPPPSDGHQEVLAWLNEALLPFVVANELGRIYFPRAVIVADGSQLEPDLMVRPLAPWRGWENAPVPLLVVEVLSKSTRRRDLTIKRDFYLELGIPEYWVVDRFERAIIRFTASSTETAKSILTWAPSSGAGTLDIDVAAMFKEVVLLHHP
jgi:Uma2 family endonuclease